MVAEKFSEIGYEYLGEFGITGRRYLRKGGDERLTHTEEEKENENEKEKETREKKPPLKLDETLTQRRVINGLKNLLGLDTIKEIKSASVPDATLMQ